jgi:hypothetical protein
MKKSKWDMREEIMFGRSTVRFIKLSHFTKGYVSQNQNQNQNQENIPFDNSSLLTPVRGVSKQKIM